MLKKMLRKRRKNPELLVETKTYTYADVVRIAEDFGNIRYNDGKRDGLAIARSQAIKTMKEILWQQNKT